MEKGRLYIVATPIGNLADITRRAAEVLSAADVVAAEDTRHTVRLLNSLGLKKAMLSFHEHSKADKYEKLFELLGEGKDIALVSDAGTPLISDPGAELVRMAVERDFEVIPIPGACSPIAALVVSGLPAGRFVFEGFLPREGAARRKALDALAAEERTALILESPMRIKSTMADFARRFGGERRAAICRELTKLHEEILRGTLAELLAIVENRELKGEMVIVLGGAEIREEAADDETVLRTLEDFLRQGQTKKDAVLSTANLLKINKNKVYKMLHNQEN